MARPNRFLFDEAIAEFRKRCGRVIVELGAIRNRRWRDSDGHSTTRWPIDALVWSVDVDPAAIQLTRELTSSQSNVFCVLADGIEFLRAFPTRIDLLYLDGPHADRGNGRKWHADAYQAAPIQHRAVLLVDDTDAPRFGKAEQVIPLAQRDGFRVVQSDRQTLMVRA